MSPMVTNGDNGTIGANGTNDDPFETMMIHWSYNGPNGDNGFNGDNCSNDDMTIFCRHWRQWREPQIIMTLLPRALHMESDLLERWIVCVTSVTCTYQVDT
jgi:hypothetical protein